MHGSYIYCALLIHFVDMGWMIACDQLYARIHSQQNIEIKYDYVIGIIIIIITIQ